MKKCTPKDQRTLGVWAVDIARRVWPLFEDARPGDKCPRNALAVARKWLRTGRFRMNEIRAAALSAHAATRTRANSRPLVLLRVLAAMLRA